MGVWSSFCQSLCSSSWLTLGLTLGGGFVTVVNVHPTWRRTSPRGVVPVGLGEGAGDSYDAAVLQKEGLFISGKKLCSFYRSMVHYFRVLLSIPVAKREPTPGYYDAYSVGTPKWAFLEESGQKNRKTTLSPLFRRVLLVNKRTLFFLWGLVIWMLHTGRAGHPGPGKRYFTPGQLSVEFVNGWWVVDLWGFGNGFMCSVLGCS